MYFRDHPPPHFVATYGGDQANIAISSGKIIDGYLPPTAARLVMEWTLAHRPALEENWKRARANFPLERIAGLDNDQGH
jgi:hypothetical protein